MRERGARLLRKEAPMEAPLPGFDGTPYVVTRVEANFYNVLLLPRHTSS